MKLGIDMPVGQWPETVLFSSRPFCEMEDTCTTPLRAAPVSELQRPDCTCHAVPSWGKKEEASTMHRSLPFGANLEAIQKEARTLLRALQRNEVAVLERYHPYDVLDDTSHPRLADAQYLIARRYGFKSWANLKGLLIHSKPGDRMMHREPIY